MEEFKSLENVSELFKSVQCNGTQNCYFVAFKDMSKNSGMVKGMEYPYDALLINQTEAGIGAFFLKYEKMSLVNDISKLVVCHDTYFFVSNNDIADISVKNWALINSKMKRVTIKLKSGKVHHLCVNVNEKLLPYHVECFAKFINKYSK